jgi:hypothetical protein
MKIINVLNVKDPDYCDCYGKIKEIWEDKGIIGFKGS